MEHCLVMPRPWFLQYPWRTTFFLNSDLCGGICNGDLVIAAILTSKLPHGGRRLRLGFWIWLCFFTTRTSRFNKLKTPITSLWSTSTCSTFFLRLELLLSASSEREVLGGESCKLFDLRTTDAEVETPVKAQDGLDRCRQDFGLATKKF